MGIFGPSQKEVWAEFAKAIEGDYKDRGIWKAKRIESKYDNWTIVFDTYSQNAGKANTTYTRIRIPFKIKEDFTFEIYNKSIFSGISKAFGKDDIELGYGDLDEKFIVKGNDGEKIKNLFENIRLRELINSQKKIYLKINKDKRIFEEKPPEDIRYLFFRDYGIIKEKERLENLYFLMVHLINQLAEMGIADREDPNITLK